MKVLPFLLTTTSISVVGFVLYTRLGDLREPSIRPFTQEEISAPTLRSKRLGDNYVELSGAEEEEEKKSFFSFFIKKRKSSDTEDAPVGGTPALLKDRSDVEALFGK